MRFVFGESLGSRALIIYKSRLSYLYKRLRIYFQIVFNRQDLDSSTVWQEKFTGIYICGLAIFGVLREPLFAIRTD